MATFNSIETAQRNSTSAAGTPLSPNKLAGKTRVLAFSWTAISSAVSADLVFLGTLPLKASVLSGRFDNAAMGASATMSIGTLSGTTFTPKWGISIAISGAGQNDFANTVALKGLLNEVLAADTDVYARFEHDNPTANAAVYGYFKYVVD